MTKETESIKDFEKMSKELYRKVEKMTTFQRKYAEYRGRGLNQADSALKAGSKSKDRGALGRVGYNTEATVDGVKEYIAYLQNLKAKSACVSETEIIEMLRDTYRSAMESGKFADANKAAELLGSYIGMFGKANKGALDTTSSKEGKIKNNVSAFKDEGETTEDRTKRLGTLLNLVNKSIDN